MVLRLVLHLAGWLAAVAAAVLFVCLIEMDPLDPRPGAAPVPLSQRSLLVYSPAGRAGRAYVDSKQKLHGQLQTLLPAAILVFTDANAKTAGFATLLNALALAEDRALDKSCPIPAYRARFDVESPAPEPRIYDEGLCVYPTWDLPDVIQKRRANRAVLLDIVSANYGDLETSTWSGAVLVAGLSSSHELIRLLHNAVRRELDRLGPAPADAAPESLLDRGRVFVAAYSTAHFDSPFDYQGGFLEDFESIGYATGKPHNQRLAVAVAGGWFVCLGRRAELVEYHQKFSDSRLIQAVHDLRRGPVACQAALWDDDPLISNLAMCQLTRGKAHTQQPLAGDLLRMLPRLADPSPGQWNEIARGLMVPFSPVEGAQHVTRIARTTVDPDLIAFLLAKMLGSRQSEVRRAAAAAILARLPRTVTQLLGQYDHRPLALTKAEREAFLMALVDRLREELATDGWKGAVYIAVEGLSLADERFLPPSSPARSRLTELGAWLVLHPTMGKSFREGRRSGVAAALAERIHDSDPEARLAAWTLQHQVSGRGALEIFLGDPFTGGRPKSPDDDF